MTPSGSPARVWRATLPSTDYEWVVLRDEVADDWDLLQRLRRLPEREDAWRPVPVALVSPTTSRAALPASMPWWSGVPNVLVLRDAAIGSVGALLRPHGELLDLECDQADLQVFCAPLLEDALIESRSVLHSPTGSAYVRLERGAFDSSQVGDLRAFTIPVGRSRQLCLTTDIVEGIRSSGHGAGVEFEEIGHVEGS